MRTFPCFQCRLFFLLLIILLCITTKYKAYFKRDLTSLSILFIICRYTKTASLPRHFVQYDQGEDRWLSTLLLKQGYRIEYAAASDAETYAPEGFEEFFNQRRRWTPSSIANTIDLLADYKVGSN